MVYNVYFLISTNNLTDIFIYVPITLIKLYFLYIFTNMVIKQLLYI